MNEQSLTPIPLTFWQSAAGGQPTRDWFRSLEREDRFIVGDDLRRLQFGWPIGMPLVKSLGGGLHELRSSLPSKREARVLFTATAGQIAVLHGFIKKSQKTPLADLNLSRKRMKDLTR